ncbi:hypothetical protein [Halegenticoccus soli]|uniref:hypothetical protein n=1 Tax=Halegenticoccus soli TaxID=1985678 RepID=UPI000C6CB99B|nr:hypothetical protein [Halegenticoccus soli]
MARRSNDSATARFERLLDHVFFAAMEVSVLGLPALYLLLFAPNPVEVSLSATTALAATTVGVAVFRGRYVDVGRWPSPGDPVTMPIRSAYYGGVLGVGSFLGGAVQLTTGLWWPGVVLPAVLAPGLLAPFPRLLARFRSAALRTV